MQICSIHAEGSSWTTLQSVGVVRGYCGLGRGEAEMGARAESGEKLGVKYNYDQKGGGCSGSG